MSKRELGLNRKQCTLNTIEERDLFWVAGLLEGEGCFTFDIRWTRGVAYRYPRIQCNMTDRDVIDRLHAIVGAGTVFVRAPAKPHHKAQHQWRLGAIEDIQPLVEMLYPLMGDRRRARLDDIRGWYAAR